jgi:hypothetical protein
MFLNSVPKGNKKGLDKGVKEQQQQVKNLQWFRFSNDIGDVW